MKLAVMRQIPHTNPLSRKSSRAVGGPIEASVGQQLCPTCRTPGCLEARGADFHARRSFGSLTCDYTGAPPFADAEWAGPENDALPSPYRMCEWCAGTGHPHGDEAYGMCKCPALRPNVRAEPETTT